MKKSILLGLLCVAQFKQACSMEHFIGAVGAYFVYVCATTEWDEIDGVDVSVDIDPVRVPVQWPKVATAGLHAAQESEQEDEIDDQECADDAYSMSSGTVGDDELIMLSDDGDDTNTESDASQKGSVCSLQRSPRSYDLQKLAQRQRRVRWADACGHALAQ